MCEDAPDLPRLAADYVFGICANHPFRDGNKRVSFLAAVVFLGLNGLDLFADDGAVVEMMMAVASGKLDEEGISGWIRSRTRPRSGT